MIETTKEDVDKLINKIYRDAKIKKSNQEFFTLYYHPEQFTKEIQEVLNSVLGFLPNTNYLGNPFVMSVSVNKGTKEIEIIVKNPKY